MYRDSYKQQLSLSEKLRAERGSYSKTDIVPKGIMIPKVNLNLERKTYDIFNDGILTLFEGVKSSEDSDTVKSIEEWKKSLTEEPAPPPVDPYDDAPSEPNVRARRVQGATVKEITSATDLSDRELLARTIQAEAGGEGLKGMLAVGSVIANRVGDGRYGESFSEVILDRGQFSAWNSYTGYAGGEQGQDMMGLRPSSEAYKVADQILSGRYESPVGAATHYYNPKIVEPSWGSKAGGSWTRIGNHKFGSAR